MTTSRSLSNRQIARAAGLVLLGFLASGLLGLLRTAVIAATFGTSAELDAFYAAQRIPELLFTLVAGGALGSSFIPVFSRFLAADEEAAAWRLASAVLTLSCAAALVLGILLALTAPLYMPLLYTRQEQQTLAIQLAQIMMLTPALFAFSGLTMGILNAHQQFTLPALAISMNNIGLIVGALVFAPLIARLGADGLAAAALLPHQWPWLASYAPPTVSVYGLALGAVLGALLHLGVQLPGLRALRPPLHLRFDRGTPGAVEVLRLMLPRMLGLGVAQLNFLVNVWFASAMLTGSLVALNTAWTLMFFALGVVAQSVGTAVFPTLAALAAAGDFEGFRARLAAAMRGVLFLALPATVGLIVLGEPVIRALFERGAWTGESTSATAWALGFFALGIAGHSLLEVLSRAFYALSDTLTPVLVGVAALLANIALSVIFVRLIGDPGSLARGPFAGLALANALTTLAEGATLWWLMRRRVGGIEDARTLTSTARAFIAALAMGIVVLIVRGALATAPAIVQVMLAGGSGAVCYFALAGLFGVEEARTVPGLLLRRFRRA